MKNIMNNLKKESADEKITASRKYLNELFDTSRIHGVRYLSEPQLHWTERLWWIISLVVSVCLCGVFITNIWANWQEHPVTLSFSEDPIPISSIPFPTVTVCPEIKTYKKTFNVNAVLNSLPNATELDKHRLQALAQICPRLSDIIELTDNFTTESIYKAIEEIARPLKEAIPFSFWYGKDIYLGKSGIKFVPILTDEGYCFTFNALKSQDMFTDEMTSDLKSIKNDSDIAYNSVLKRFSQNLPYTSLENEITRQWTRDKYPLRSLDLERQSGVILAPTINDPNPEFRCRYNFQGFRVLLTEPGEVVKMSRNFYRVPFAADTRLTIKGKFMSTSDGLRKYDPNRRQCYFADERHLRFYKIYTQSNCEEECLANLTNTQCGCVKFSMPRDQKTLICGSAKMKCYQQVEKDLKTKFMKFYETCNCLPACTSMEYNARVEHVKLDWNTLSKDPEAYYNRKEQKSILFIFFGDHVVETVKRVESCTIPDMLAYCGGLFGLFMGISMLSFIEFVFYSTLHLFWTLRKKSSEVQDTVERSVGKFKKAVADHFREFCKNSNIHGVLYFSRQQLHWSERLWWVAAICVSLWLSSSLTNRVWVKWQENPVEISFTKEKMDISTIPFPTVTICPEIKSIQHKLDIGKLLETNLNVSNKELKDLNTMANVNSFLRERVKRRRNQQPNLPYPKYSNESIFNEIKEVAPQFRDFIQKCRFRNVEFDCAKYIVPVFTDQGYCFSFNAMNSQEIYSNNMAPGVMTVKTNPSSSTWSLITGFRDQSNEYPLRVFDSGRNGALEISFALYDKDFISIYKIMEKGSKVALSAPGDIPTVTRNYWRAPLLEDTRIIISPKFTNTSEELRRYSSSKRKCFFEDERKLRFFKHYSQRNCLDECLANITQKICGCVHYVQPRNLSQELCGLNRSVFCCRDVKNNFTMDLAYHGGNNSRFDRCNCLPACASIKYDAEVDRMLFDPVLLKREGVTQKDGLITLHGRLTVYFGDEKVMAMKRIEAYTLTDFMATCGGLLGLFLGISALSIIEIVYCFTLRWYWIIRRSKSTHCAKEVAEHETVHSKTNENFTSIEKTEDLKDVK